MEPIQTGKGIKRVKGRPVHEKEMKRARSICITDSTWENLQVIARSKGLSRGQLVELTFKVTADEV